jgi:hypothetical protein
MHLMDLGLRRHTTQRYTTPGPPSMREIHSATMVNSYVESKWEFNVTPAGHQKSAGQPDVINT